MCKLQLNRYPDEWPAVVGLDIETTGLDPFTGKILSVQVYDGTHTWVYLHTHGIVQNAALKALFTNATVTKIAHNAEFEMLWIKVHCGVDIVNVYDSLIAEQVLSAGKMCPVALKDVIARRCGLDIPKETRKEFEDHPGFHIRPVTDEQLNYMERDVKYLLTIRKQQMEEISAARLGHVLALEFQLLPVIVKLRFNGLKFDTDKWEAALQDIETEVQKVELEIRHSLVDLPLVLVKKKPHTRTVKHEDGTKTREKWTEDVDVTLTPETVNLGSIKHLALIFGALGIPLDSTGESVISEWAAKELDNQRGIEFVTRLLQWREWKKLAGWNYPQYINPVTHKIHPEWQQNGADTGRLSCRNPNLQNVPKPNGSGPNLRRLWIPDNEEYVIICLDYSQQEPRVLAQLCGDPALIAACNEKDVYIEFAKQMYGRTVEKGSTERQIAKQFVLAVGYGAGSLKLHSTSKLPVDECERIRNVIRSTFPGAVAWGQAQHRHLSQYGYTTTALGRRRYFPKQEDRRYTTAVNTPVQGTSAEMMKLALVNVNSFLTDSDFDATIWLTVHDELEVMVRREQADALVPHLISIMEQAGKTLCPDVLHIAEAKIFPTWDK